MIPKLLVVAGLSVALLAGCAYVPGDPMEVAPVEGDALHPPAPVQAPSNVGATVSGSWTGYWTWVASPLPGHWEWTWVWNANTGNFGTS